MLHSVTFDQLGLLFFTALFLSIVFVPLTVKLAERLGAVDHPKFRSSHSRAVTRLGGLGIAGSFLVACLLYLPINDFVGGLLAGLVVIVLTGLADDLLDISPRWKFVGQILAALVFIWVSGENLQNLGNLFGGEAIHLGMFAIPFTVFCMVGGMNALNMVDGLDGLAAGIATIAATFFAYLAWEAGAPYLILISVALMGSLLGFLRYNSYPARLFMGDTGSLMLGYILAVVLVSGSQIDPSAVPLTAWVLVVALPLLDILLVMGRRIFQGDSPFSPDRTHLHHRLLSLRLPHAVVVGFIYVATSLFGWLAVLLLPFPDWVMFAAVFVTGIVIYVLVFELQHALSVSRNRREFRLLRDLKQNLSKFRERANRVSFYAVPVNMGILVLLCLPVLFAPVVPLARGQAIAMLLLSVILILYCQSQNRQDSNILHGTVYLAMAALIFMYNLTPEASGHWLHIYVAVLVALASIWLALKLLFRKNVVPLKASGFELLILFISSFFPLLIFDEMNFSPYTVEAGHYAIIQAIPLLIVSKIYFNNDPGNFKWVVRAFALAIALVAIRGYASI